MAKSVHQGVMGKLKAMLQSSWMLKTVNLAIIVVQADIWAGLLLVGCNSHTVEQGSWRFGQDSLLLPLLSSLDGLGSKPMWEYSHTCTLLFDLSWKSPNCITQSPTFPLHVQIQLGIADENDPWCNLKSLFISYNCQFQLAGQCSWQFFHWTLSSLSLVYKPSVYSQLCFARYVQFPGQF